MLAILVAYPYHQRVGKLTWLGGQSTNFGWFTDVYGWHVVIFSFQISLQECIDDNRMMFDVKLSLLPTTNITKHICLVKGYLSLGSAFAGINHQEVFNLKQYGKRQWLISYWSTLVACAKRVHWSCIPHVRWSVPPSGGWWIKPPGCMCRETHVCWHMREYTSIQFYTCNTYNLDA